MGGGADVRRSAGSANRGGSNPRGAEDEGGRDAVEEPPQSEERGAGAARLRISPAGSSGKASPGPQPMSDAGSPSRKRSAAMESVAAKWEGEARREGFRRRVHEEGTIGVVPTAPVG